MKVVGSVYEGEKTYLALYNQSGHDIYLGNLSGIDESQRVGHFSYTKVNSPGCFDVFLIDDESNLDSFKITKKFNLTSGSMEITDFKKGTTKNIDSREYLASISKHDYSGEILDTYLGHGEVGDFALADVYDYCGDSVAKISREKASLTTVEKIAPRTKLEKIVTKVPIGNDKKVEQLIVSGKNKYVGQCLCYANLDFSKGCVTSWLALDNADFDGKTFTNYVLSPEGRCEYCYVWKENKPFPKSIVEFDKKQLIKELNGECYLEPNSDKIFGKKVEFLRFGQLTEPYSEFTKESFIQALEAMTETKTKGIIATKFLPFKENEHIKDLLIKTNSAVLYGYTGLNHLESGATSFGSTDEWRVEQAIKYKEAGVNSGLFFQIRAHSSLTDREREVIDLAGKHNLPIQFIPTRPKNKKIVAKIIPDISWDFLKGYKGQGHLTLDGLETGAYEPLGNNSLISRLIHSDYLRLVKDKPDLFSICNHNSEIVHCGGCLQVEGSVSGPIKRDKSIRPKKPRKNKTKKNQTNVSEGQISFE